MIDNRETAMVFWLAVLLVWALWKPKIREGLVGVIRVALAWKIVLAVMAMLAYVGLLVLGVYKLGVWNIGNLKATVLWLLTAAPVMVYEVVSNPDEKNYFGKAALAGLKVSVVLEFLVGFYVLSLPLELVLVPVVTLLVCVLVLAESREEFKVLRRPLNTLIATLGIGLLAYAVHRLYVDFDWFARWATLVEFLLPIVLTLLFLPFLYLLAVFVSYENVFVRLQFFIADPDLLRFTKRRLILTFGLNYHGLTSWMERFIHQRPRSKEEILTSLRTTSGAD